MRVCLVFEQNKIPMLAWHTVTTLRNFLQAAHVNRISALLMKRWWQMTGALLFHRNNFLRLLKGFIIEHLIKRLVIILAYWQCRKGGISWSLPHFHCLKTWWLFKEAGTTSLLLFYSHIHIAYLGMDLILCFKYLMQSVRFWYRCYLVVWSCSWWANILRLA